MSESEQPNVPETENDTVIILPDGSISTDITIDGTSTICNNCAFASFTEDGNVQTGCLAGRLEKFRDAGVTVHTARTQGQTYHVIDSKTCVYYRNDEWAREVYKDEFTTDEEYDEFMLKTVTSQLDIPYAVLLFIRTTDLDVINQRLDELEAQRVKPKIVTLIDRTHDTDIISGDLMKIMQNRSFTHWRIQVVAAVDHKDAAVIDIAYDNTKKLQYVYYTALEAEHAISLDMSSEFHSSIHDQAKAFSLLTGTGIHGHTVLKIAHAKYNGNSFDIPLEAKLVHYNDSPHLIKKVEDICPSLKIS